MEYNLHINERLEKQNVAELLEKRGELLKTDDYAAQNELMNTIVAELVMNTTFIAPVQLGENSGDEQALTFRLIQNPQGTRFFPAFTSSKDLETWEDLGSTDTVQMTFDGYAEIIRDNDAMGGIAVNPFSDNLTVDRRLVLNWYERKQLVVNGYSNHTITDNSHYEFFELEPYPTELSDKLCETAKAHPEITRLWLRGIRLEGADGYLAIAEVDKEPTEIFRELGGSVRELLGGAQLHIVRLGPGFGELAAEGVTPIYTV